ncbi:alpha/beta hydrolase [Haloechinothrix sp. YIM 98757]|uniref:Alpha/beta hydrolase n=1 Tax=Haloechinothrix aidingensis TaxID=2752311 RepID=A0A838ACP0_9PSEU|nr:alpha/beta hydrolase [Haloechinothrix aidingensis]MBA0127039.1 alpha/beta hydrolase [Haloechinothrix aidingensis]
MGPSFRTRRAAQLALTANALRPLRGKTTAIPSFFAGWLTSELAPHLLAANCADTAIHLARRGRRDRIGLALSAASAAGLVALMSSAHRARDTVEDALVSALGPGYKDQLSPPSHPSDLSLPLDQLMMPFRMRSPEVRRTRDIAYAHGGKRYLLDVYRPRAPHRNRPVLLQIHGGAWMVGNKDQQGLPLMLHMAKRGWVCVSVNYPLSPRARWPAHIVAIKQALAWVKSTIADYGGDPSFVAVTGGSAGGHLASLLALTPNDPAWQPGFDDVDTSVQACVPHYGAYDFAAQSGSQAAKAMRRSVLERYVVGKDAETELDTYLAASPLHRINPDAPPFFVLHGEHDSLIPVADARVFVDKLRATSHRPVAYAEVPGAQHAFDIFPSIRSAHVVRGVQRFLEWTYTAQRVQAPPAAEGTGQSVAR